MVTEFAIVLHLKTFPREVRTFFEEYFSGESMFSYVELDWADVMAFLEEYEECDDAAPMVDLVRKFRSEVEQKNAPLVLVKI